MMLNKIKKMIGILIEDEKPIDDISIVKKYDHDMACRVMEDKLCKSKDIETQLEYNNMVIYEANYKAKLLANYEMQIAATMEVRRMEAENERIAQEKRFYKAKMLLIC